MKNIKRWSVALGILIFAWGMAGCDLQKNNDPVLPPVKKVNIVFWDENAGADRTKYYRVLIDKFEKENPDIHVEYVGLPKKAVRLKINTAISTNELPDVCGMQSAWLAEFYSKKVLLNLDPYFSDWDEKDDIREDVLAANRALVRDGGLYQLPNTIGMEILWYRSDWFQAAGLQPPADWDSFFADAAALTDKEHGHYGYTLRGGDGAAIQLIRMMFAYTGYTSFFAPDGHCVLNDSRNVEFLHRYMGLYQTYTPTGDITNGYQEMIAVFDTGQAAMVQHNLGSYGLHKRFLRESEYAPLMLPRALDGSIMQEANNVDGYAIFRSTEHPKEAWRFVSFLCSEEGQSYWNRSIGQIPTNKKSLNEEWLEKLPHMRLAKQELMDVKFKFYNPPMYLPEYRSIVDSGDHEIESVIMGEESVEQFLDRWAAAFEQAKKKYDEQD